MPNIYSVMDTIACWISRLSWQAVSALGTLLVVIVALFGQEIRRLWSRPKVDLDWFEPKDPHLVRQIGASYEATGRHEPYEGLFITLELTNTGKQTASEAEVLLTRVATNTAAHGWRWKENWTPIPLEWVLGQSALQRDLIPQRPYLIRLASFGPARKGQLLITYAMSLKSQTETFEPGQHCFEVSVFATGARTRRKFVYVTFQDFSQATDLNKVRDFVQKVEMSKTPPC